MAGRFNFVNPGAAAATSLSDFLIQREVARRQQLQDALAMKQYQDAQAERQRQAERQARLDQQAENEALRRTAVADDERAYGRERDRIGDERYAAEQAANALKVKDAAAQKYLDVERGYFEDQQKRQFDASEAAKDRASQERRTAMGSAGSSSKPTQGQLTADTFYGRAVDALDIVDSAEKSLSTWDLVAPSFAQSAAGQTYTQAKRQWVEAYLRKDSGAAIGKDEYANADRAYFPQVGDKPETLKRKREARERITETIRAQGTGGNGIGNGRKPTARELIEKYGR